MEAKGETYAGPLSIESVIASCVLEEGKLCYRVKWKPTWVLETQLPDGVLTDYKTNKKTRRNSCDGTFSVTADKTTKDGQRLYLLCRRNTWEDEHDMKRITENVLDMSQLENSGSVCTVKEEEDLGDYGSYMSSSHIVIPLIKSEELEEKNQENTSANGILTNTGFENHCDNCKGCILSEQDINIPAENVSRGWKCQNCYKTFCVSCSENGHEDNDASWLCKVCIDTCCGEIFGQKLTAGNEASKDKINFPFFHRPLTQSTTRDKNLGDSRDERKEESNEGEQVITGIRVLYGNHKDYVNPRRKSVTTTTYLNREICEPTELFSKQRGRPITEDKLDDYQVCKNDTDEAESDLGSDRSIEINEPGQFKCQFCSTIFSRQYTLDTHLRVHTGAKPYQCHICGANFRQSGTRSTHIRAVHFKERPFQCEVCGKTFSHKSSITVHLRTHTKEKPYQCEICENRFTDRATLSKHRLVHTGMKPYECSECGQRFSQKSNLKRHYKAKHMTEEEKQDLSTKENDTGNNSSKKESKERSSNSNSSSNDVNSFQVYVKQEQDAYPSRALPEVTDDIPENDALYFSFETTDDAENASEALNGSEIFNESSDDVTVECGGRGQNKACYIRFPWQHTSSAAESS